MVDISNIHKKPLYFDHHATTPVDPRVLESMLPFFTESFGNAASVDHLYGDEAAREVEKSRGKIASLIGCHPQEIIFTSGATESNNLAIIGVARRYSEKGRHIVTCITEHKAVLDTCKYLETEGFQITYLKVNKQGLIDLDELNSAIKDETILISVMSANNEIGTLSPLAEIGAIAKGKGILFHSDAAQAFGHIPIDVEAMGIDLLSISGHKIYGPKGVGALYVRRLRPRVKLASLIHGGDHEHGLRAGTLNVPGIVGLGVAAELAKSEMPVEGNRLITLRTYLLESLRRKIEGIELNGHPVNRLPHNLSVYLPGIENRALLVMLKRDVALSTGSACTSTNVEPSHVILALGYSEERAHSTLRIGLGRGNTKNEIDYLVDRLTEAVRCLRSLNQAHLSLS
ncbi:Cysteine desulfurase [Dehalococcoides mccartyi]|uniref:Cysteine desulfurase IscS n=1 Tax=Dehalococcoides mccartyi TaxID=61435 RepID=A0A328EPJ2_9CHLR|nr:Cysteine desulfurase [Dehalococcoides mccartyi]RAL70564.1 Cysteine desulfurase [Dehalococcoides mccartyi]